MERSHLEKTLRRCYKDAISPSSLSAFPPRLPFPPSGSCFDFLTRAGQTHFPKAGEKQTPGPRLLSHPPRSSVAETQSGLPGSACPVAVGLGAL